MKTKKSIFTIIISAVYIVTFAAFILSLFIEYNAGLKTSQKKFTELTASVSKNLRTNPVGTTAFRDTFINSLDPVSDFLSVQLKYEDILLATYPLTKTTENTSALVKTFSTVLTSSDQKNITLTSSIYLLKPYTIYNNARVSFMIILVATLAYLLYIIILKTSNKATDSLSEQDTDTQKDQTEENSISDEEAEEITHQEQIEKEKQLIQSISMEEPGEIIEEKTEEIHDPLFITEMAEQINLETKQEESITEVDTSKQIDEIKNSFDSQSGFGVIQSLIPHLDNELVRAASSSQDLSIIQINIENMAFDNPLIKAIGSVFIDDIRFTDQIFEYKDNNFILIMEDTSIDKALLIAQNMYIKIKKVCTMDNQSHNIYMGLSSRTIRLITADRILNEAENALNKAKEDKANPIVAFKVDPDKYLDYINTEESKAS